MFTITDENAEFSEYWDWFVIRAQLPNAIISVGKDKWIVKYDNVVYGIFNEKDVHRVLFYLQNIRKNIDMIKDNVGDI